MTFLVFKRLLQMMKSKRLIANLHLGFIQTKTEHRQHRMPLRKWAKHTRVYLMLKNVNIMICLEVSKANRHNSMHKTLTLMRYSDRCFKDKDSTTCLGKHLQAKGWAEDKVAEVVMILLQIFYKVWCKDKWVAVVVMVEYSEVKTELLHSHSNHLVDLTCISKVNNKIQRDLNVEI